MGVGYFLAFMLEFIIASFHVHPVKASKFQSFEDSKIQRLISCRSVRMYPIFKICNENIGRIFRIVWPPPFPFFQCDRFANFDGWTPGSNNFKNDHQRCSRIANSLFPTKNWICIPSMLYECEPNTFKDFRTQNCSWITWLWTSWSRRFCSFKKIRFVLCIQSL